MSDMKNDTLKDFFIKLVDERPNLAMRTMCDLMCSGRDMAFPDDSVSGVISRDLNNQTVDCSGRAIATDLDAQGWKKPITRTEAPQSGGHYKGGNVVERIEARIEKLERHYEAELKAEGKRAEQACYRCNCRAI